MWPKLLLLNMASSDNSTNVSIPIPQYHVQKDLATSYLTEEVSDFFVVTIFIFCVYYILIGGKNKLAISLCKFLYLLYYEIFSISTLRDTLLETCFKIEKILSYTSRKDIWTRPIQWRKLNIFFLLITVYVFLRYR